MYSFVGGAVFCLDQNGPKLLMSTPQNTFCVEDYFKMGNFFYLAIGQGNTRNYGLYELPVPTYRNYHAYVYAFDVLDEQTIDTSPRARETNYCLLVLYFPLNIRDKLPHPVDMERAIKEELVFSYRLDQLKDIYLNKRNLTKICLEIENYNTFYNQQPNAAVDEPFNVSNR